MTQKVIKMINKNGFSSDLRHLEMKTKVELHTEEEECYWSMTITVSSKSKGFALYFFISEPYLTSLNDWKQVAAGETPASTKNGLEYKDGYYHVDDDAHGLGNDIHSKMSIKKEYLSSKLICAIDEAVDLNLKFA
jgi:hypothetical protein